MSFITKAEPKKETKTASIQLDLETRNDLDLYVEFVDKPQGVVLREILQKVFQMDEEFADKIGPSAVLNPAVYLELKLRCKLSSDVLKLRSERLPRNRNALD